MGDVRCCVCLYMCVMCDYGCYEVCVMCVMWVMDVCLCDVCECVCECVRGV